MKAKDIVGQRFGKLVVISRAGTNAHNMALWLCKCDCGSSITAIGMNLRSGRTSSCGCFRQQCVEAGLAKTHGQCGRQAQSPTYRSWKHMKSRCDNPKDERFKDYGGRGISYDPAWNEFEGFFADMGERPEGLSLDRKDVNGNYVKDNCRWATPKEQANNRRNTQENTRGEY